MPGHKAGDCSTTEWVNRERGKDLVGSERGRSGWHKILEEERWNQGSGAAGAGRESAKYQNVHDPKERVSWVAGGRRVFCIAFSIYL